MTERAVFIGARVVVTGATGFLGGALVRALSEIGAQVIAVARQPGRAGFIRDLRGVKVVMGDITDGARMREVMAGSDMVFHVAAALGGDLSMQRRVNIDGTRQVIRAASAAGAGFLVHVSTISVYGYRHRRNVTEALPLTPGADPYAITKAAAESVVREECSIPYAIIRPGMIYGPRSAFWTNVAFRIARQHPLVWVGSGRGSAYLIHVDDVVDMMLTLVTAHPRSNRQVFHCTPDPSPTFREYLEGLAALTGEPSARWVGLPPEALRAISDPLTRLAPRYSQARDVPHIIGLVDSYLTYRMDKARALLGWQPRIGLSDGIASCAPYLRDIGLL